MARWKYADATAWRSQTPFHSVAQGVHSSWAFYQAEQAKSTQTVASGDLSILQ
jgi:hypothetical protein